MNTITLILLIIAFVSLLLVIVFACYNRAIPFYLSVLLLLCSSIGSVIYHNYANGTLWGEKHPTALDVYRGKTTLEITYRDSVAVDSVVVYKMK
jgi:uncharacterized protein YdaL